MGICSDVSTSEYNALTIINVIAASLSIIGSLATIISFLKSKDKRQHFNQYIFFLALTDLGATGCILVTQGITHLKHELNTHDFCVDVRAALNFFFVSSFFWTTCIAIHMYRAVNHLPAYKWLYTTFHLFSWGVPLLLVIVEVSEGLIVSGKAEWCNLQETYEWSLWFAPMIASVFVNFIIYLFIIRSFKSKAQTRSPFQSTAIQRRMENVITKRFTFYLLAFVFCWIWNIIGHIIQAFNNDCNIYFLWVLQNFASPLQGFLNFIVYGLSNRMLQNCLTPKKLVSYREYSSRNEQDRIEEQPLKFPGTYTAVN